MRNVALTVNGTRHELELEPRELLVYVLRERLGLTGRLAPLPVRRLSAGQMRRTALACLVARRATLWLLDEPHAGLDADGRDELDTTLREAATAGATIVVASHELERAGGLATRVVDVVAGQTGGPAA